MPATDDRWDVVVVGLRDPSPAAARMAVAELAHYASLPPQDVERLLEEGEVPILENLDRAEAERAAYELAELGALVDLRLAMTDSGVFPVFKPDAERQIGVAVGGLIDDSATPPTVGAALGLPELEPDREPPQPPRARATTRPPVSGGSAAGGRGPSKPVEPPRRGPDAAFVGPPALDDEPPPPPPPRPARPAPDPRAGDSGSGRPRASTPAPGDSLRARATTPAPGDSGTGARGRAGAPTSSAGSRPKPAASGVESLLGDIGPAAPAAPKLPQRLQRAASAAAEGPVALEVDFAAAGMAPPPKRGFSATPAPTPDRSADDMPRRTRAGQMGGTGASAAGRQHRDGGVLEVLRSDGVAMLLVGLGVGLALSLVLALQIQRSSVRDTLPPLEEELAASLADPGGVAEGKRRAPAAIEEELDGALGDLQRSFLLWWLGPGLAVGLLLSRLKEG